MKLIITEKPSVARDIAKVLKAHSAKNGFIEGNGFWITWALGHLIEFCQPDAYGPEYQKWSFDQLPMIPMDFKKKVIERSSDQFRVVESLCQKEEVDEVICATDAGREGELIFRMIYEQTGCRAPIRRLWISSQTDQAILEGFKNLKPGSEYLPLFDSALSRAEADWLVGINATRAYTLKFSRGHGVMSVGRVQTPVLKMIVDRYRDHKRFSSKDFYEVFVDVSHPNGIFRAKWFNQDGDRLQDKIAAEALAKDIEAIKEGKILSLVQKEKIEKQPLLYDLTELQKDANLKFKYSADETLKLMQDLYEKHKILTYPRTSSRYISKDVAAKLPELVQNLKDLPFAKDFVADIINSGRSISERMVDDQKVTDHHAIIPTDKKPELSYLSPEHFAIYELVIRRFLAAFMPECLKDHTEIITELGQHKVKATGTVIRRKGWRSLYGEDSPNEDAKTDEGTLLPMVHENDPVKSQKTDLKKGNTKAPPLHTEASILAAMETAGKSIDDEELRQAMKNCGLGTPATRAQILEKLIKTAYILREKNKLIPTQKGETIIDCILDEALLKPELTGDWEKKLNDMAQNTFSRADYIEEIKSFTKSLVANVMGANVYILSANQKLFGACPKCETGKVIETPKAYSCSNWKGKGCKFVIWKQLAGKTLTEIQIEALLQKGKTSVIKGFKSKAGNTFNASLILQNGEIQMDFVKEVLGPCPKCGGHVVETPKAFSCDQWRTTKCSFVIWKKMGERDITLTEAKVLLQKAIAAA